MTTIRSIVVDMLLVPAEVEDEEEAAEEFEVDGRADAGAALDEEDEEVVWAEEVECECNAVSWVTCRSASAKI